MSLESFESDCLLEEEKVSGFHGQARRPGRNTKNRFIYLLISILALYSVVVSCILFRLVQRYGWNGLAIGTISSSSALAPLCKASLHIHGFSSFVSSSST